METEKDINEVTSDIPSTPPEESPVSQETKAPASLSKEEEVQQLLSRLNELTSVNNSGSLPATEKSDPSLQGVAETINKAMSFRPMQVDNRSVVEKYLMRPDGPLARHYNIKQEDK